MSAEDWDSCSDDPRRDPRYSVVKAKFHAEYQASLLRQAGIAEGGEPDPDA